MLQEEDHVPIQLNGKNLMRNVLKGNIFFVKEDTKGRK